MHLFGYQLRHKKRTPSEQFVRRLQLKGEFPPGEYTNNDNCTVIAAELTTLRRLGMLFDFDDIQDESGQDFVLIFPRDCKHDPVGEWPWRYKYPQ